MTGLPTYLPAPRTPELGSAPPLRWGILGTGWIASLFATAVREHTAQRLVAVGSRDVTNARRFAADNGVERSHGDYRRLVEDPEIDAVYIATPHSTHREHALLAIAAGKPVLVEKSFTQTAAQAAEVIAAARAAKVAVLEAMWTRYLPQSDVIRQLLADRVLGDLVTVAADHGQFFPYDPAFRLYNPDLAGGAILDLGVYPISFASFAQGAPTSVTATGVLAGTGVDGQVSITLGRGDSLAVLHTTLFANTPTTAAICGTLARIEIPGPFYGPQPVTLVGRDGERRVWDANTLHGHQGLAYEAEEMARVVSDGRLESDLLPLAETLTIMQTMDEIRRQVGAVLPGD